LRALQEKRIIFTYRYVRSETVKNVKPDPMKKHILALSFFISLAAYSQNLKLVTGDDIPGLQMTGSVSYSLQDLRNYAGANYDLCREYGFRSLDVYDYSFQGEQARLEVYRMEDSPSAFGIYSVSISNCTLWNRYSTFSCSTPYQIAASFGPFFFKIKDLKKTRGGQSLCEQVMQQIIAKNPQDRWYMPALFQHPKLGNFIRSLKYAKGLAGLSIAGPPLMSLLEDLPFNCYTLDVTNPAFTGILARIQFPDFNSMDRFLSNAGLNTSGQSTPVMNPNGMYRSWYKISDTKMVYLECSSPDLKLSDLAPDKPEMYDYYY
jgi:hypothetical protein